MTQSAGSPSAARMGQAGRGWRGWGLSHICDRRSFTWGRVETSKGKAPDFRVVAEDGIEIGGAWKRKSKSGNVYLSVRLDDPSFTAPVYANLIERDGQHLLIWNR